MDWAAFLKHHNLVHSMSLAVATRYHKPDDNFLASIQLASIRIWLGSYESVTYSILEEILCGRSVQIKMFFWPNATT